MFLAKPRAQYLARINIQVFSFRTEDKQTPASDLLIDYVYCHWSSNPYIRAAYSSPSVHARGSREILARPVADCVFFAGEATRSQGDCASVSGALESGVKAAEDVKNTLLH
jgi:monoamine oxidase